MAYTHRRNKNKRVNNGRRRSTFSGMNSIKSKQMTIMSHYEKEHGMTILYNCPRLAQPYTLHA